MSVNKWETPNAWDSSLVISVAGVTPNYNYTAVSGAVSLTVPSAGEYVVVGSTPNYDYAAVSGVVSLTVPSTGDYVVVGSTPNYDYAAISGAVSIGSSQVIGSVVVGFKVDMYSVGFSPDTVTVSFAR